MARSSSRRRPSVPASSDATGDSLATQTLDSTRPRGTGSQSIAIRRPEEGARSTQTQDATTAGTQTTDAAPIYLPDRVAGPTLKDPNPTKPTYDPLAEINANFSRDMEGVMGNAGLSFQRGGATRTKKARRGTDLSELAGSIDEEGHATPPNTLEVAQDATLDLGRLADDEMLRANQALDDTRGAAAAREGRMEGDIDAGIQDAEGVAQLGADIAQQGKADVAGLPGRVAADIQGIADRYRQDTDVDINKIEGLGREAVGLAMQGKNAAAEAAVSAQQNSLRQAISQINADPNIPQSRKTAMIAQIRTQGSMSIAAVIGANIKDFTDMQVGAMTSTMNAVGSALTARNQSLGAMGTAEINAVSNAHQTVAQISKGYDDLAMNARTNSAQITLNYNNLRNSARGMNNTNDLALLNDDFYLGGMPYDFRMMDYNLTRDALGTDFATKLHASGYNTMIDAARDGQQWARDAFVAQMMADTIGGPAGAILALGKMGAFDTILEGLI